MSKNHTKIKLKFAFLAKDLDLISNSNLKINEL